MTIHLARKFRSLFFPLGVLAVFFMAQSPSVLLASATTDRECVHNGKKVDFEDKDVTVFIEGEVRCRRMIVGQNVTERFVMSRGRVLEEEFKSPERHTLKRYKVINRQTRQHGEQLEFAPGTQTVIERENYIDGRQLGRSERFYKSGKLREIRIFVRDGDDPDAGVRDAASAGYLEDGALTFLRCSKNRDENFDPKLCGFNGPSRLEFKSEGGQLVRRATYVKGEAIESETAARPHSAWASLLNTGVVREPKAATQKTEALPNGHRQITEQYANGQVKRRMEVDDRGELFGKDEEFYESGQKARETQYAQLRKSVVIKDSSCWWQNGQRKSNLVANLKTEELQQRLWWDNGKEAFNGRFALEKRSGFGREISLESLIQCEGQPWGAKPVGKHTSFRRDGSKETEVHFSSEGQREGFQRRFDEKGTLEFEMIYKADKLLRQKTWKDGVLQSDEEYFEDGSIKSSN